MKYLADYTINDYYFDCGMALYYWLSHNYEGQFCPKYAAMCSLEAVNLPDIFDGYEPIANEMYNCINSDNWEAVLTAYNKAYEENR